MLGDRGSKENGGKESIRVQRKEKSETDDYDQAYKKTCY